MKNTQSVSLIGELYSIEGLLARINLSLCDRYHEPYSELVKGFLSESNPTGAEPVPSMSHAFARRNCIGFTVLFCRIRRHALLTK